MMLMEPTTTMNNNNAAATQLNRLPSQDKGAVRRVVFSETLPKHHTTSSGGDYEHQRIRNCVPRLFACCAWICLGVFGILLALLVVAIIFMSFLQSGLPEISIKKLELSKFEIIDINSTTTNQNNALLNAKVEMSVQMKNENDKMELTYSNIVVNVVSEDVKLGNSVIAGFAHNPGNATSLNVTMEVVGDPVDRDSALELEDDKKRVEMVVQVTMEATIGFRVGMFNMKKVPIHVGCDVQQFLLVNRIKNPPCSIRMFPIR